MKQVWIVFKEQRDPFIDEIYGAYATEEGAKEAILALEKLVPSDGHFLIYSVVPFNVLP